MLVVVSFFIAGVGVWLRALVTACMVGSAGALGRVGEVMY